VDPNNPVVKLCIEGMQAAADGRDIDARRLFEQAWAARSDDYDACVAAHFLARQQETDEDALRWNQVALEHASAVADDRVESFYPSLYLNMGRSHEDLGEVEQARRYYEMAAASVGALARGDYGDVVRSGIIEAVKRTSL
jgi:tetratricopeptide (TPR) repeat protein